MLGQILFGLFGLTVLIGIGWLFSNNRRAVDWQLVLTGVSLQIAFAAVVLLVPGGKDVFDALGHGFVKVLGFVGAGSNFIFGSLMDTTKFGFIFAFQVLPTIIFFDQHGKEIPQSRISGFLDAKQFQAWVQPLLEQRTGK